MAYTDDQVVGKDANLYYDSASTYATPTWTEIKRVGDVNLNLGKNQGSTRTREVALEVSGGGTKTASLSFTYVAKKGADTVADALQDSWLNDTKMEFAMLDGPSGTSGSKGYRMIGIVNSYNQSQAFDDPLAYDVEVTPSITDESGTLRTLSAYTIA